MPKLLRSTETAGCGATIELDSREVVYVSIAQSGVIVRLLDTRGGFLKSILSNFIGPLLYNEKSVYKNAQLGMVLKLLYPEQAPELNLKNPILAAFSNAIWNCSSAARVTTLLNETAINAPAAEELAERIGLTEASGGDACASRTRPLTQRALLDAVADYGEIMETQGTAILDVSGLPLPKEQMKLALHEAWRTAPDERTREFVKFAYLQLSKFQPGIGDSTVDCKLPEGLDLKRDAAILDSYLVWSKKADDELRQLNAELSGLGKPR